MPDRDDLDLSPLARTPVGPLPGAGAARERGEQRTRRTRAALAGAGALVAVLALTAGTALSGGRDRVAPAPFADPSPRAVEEGLAGSLLDPEDLPGNWEPRPTRDYPFAPLPDGCRDEQEVFGAPAATAARFLDGEGRIVGHALKGYADEAQAQAAFGRMVDAIEACGEPTFTLLGGLAGSGPDRVYGRYVQAELGVGFVVERFGAVLSGTAVRAVRPDPADEELPPLAEAARAEVAGGPFDAPEPVAPSPPPAPGPDAALLDPDAAASVEPGPWRVSTTELGRSFDPCQGSPPLTAPAQTASRLLFVDRDAGGTRLAHQVLLYESPDEATRALQELREAVGRCAPNPVDGGDGTTRYEVLEEERFGDLLVRVDEQCPACPGSPFFVVVAQASRGLSVLRVVVVEEGGPGAGLLGGYGDLARERLAALVGG